MGRAVIASALFIACLGVALQSLATALNPSGPPLVFIAALCWNFLGLALEFSSLGLADFSPSLENRISVFTKTRFCSALPPRCVLRVSPAMPEASVQTLLCWVSGNVPVTLDTPAAAASGDGGHNVRLEHFDGGFAARSCRARKRRRGAASNAPIPRSLSAVADVPFDAPPRSRSAVAAELFDQDKFEQLLE